NPLLEGSGRLNPANRRLPVGNLINRLVGCVIFRPLLTPVVTLLTAFDSDPVRLTANFHMLFNIVMAVPFLFLLGPFAALLERWLPEVKETNDVSVPRYHDESVTESPAMALTCATRETMRMADLVDSMLQSAIKAIMTNDRKLVAEVRQRDNAVDRLHEAIKLYVVKITHGSLDEAEGRRAMEILSLAINLEHIGDIIDKNLMELASKKIKRQLQFSPEGAAELEEFHRIVRENLNLATAVFLTADVKSARQLLDEKTRIRELEFSASENHMARLKEGLVASIETSSLHLDILRDLKRIHSHICATAYPALEAAGELRPSRLKAPTASQAAESRAGEPGQQGGFAEGAAGRPQHHGYSG